MWRFCTKMSIYSYTERYYWWDKAEIYSADVTMNVRGYSETDHFYMRYRGNL